MQPKPTEAELSILQVLWQNGPSSVRFVNEKLSENKDVGYTTTLKLMQIMTDKGLVKRNTDKRMHIYSANVKEKETKTLLIQYFVDTAFQGSAMNLVMQTLGNQKATKEELEKIKEIIKNLENKKQ